MKLTSVKALEMLNNEEKKSSNNKWIKHSKCVGNTAGIIAQNLNLDVDKAKTLGYIHDIGKAVGGFDKHPLNGYNYILELGYDKEYANVCLTHSYLNDDIYCAACKVPEDFKFEIDFVKNHECNIYEKLITLCDLMCTTVNLTMEERLIDILSRRGVHENTQYFLKEAQNLKNEFDNMLGKNVYEIIPDLKRY